MARPKASPEQQAQADYFFGRGYGPTAILRQLELGFPTPVSIRTVKTWVKKFKSQRDDITRFNEPFEWHRLDEYDLPWEAGTFLLRTWRNVQEYWRERYQDLFEVNLPPPTFREVRWWWRVRNALPDNANGVDVWLISWRFLLRELECRALGIPLDVKDLEAHLAYRPWLPENRPSYDRAIEEERIPELRLKQTYHDSQHILATALGGALKSTISPFVLIAAISCGGLHHPELLPSDQTQEFPPAR